MSRFLDPVVLELTDEVSGGRVVRRVAHAFRFEVGRNYSGIAIMVPANLKTDLASVPRFLHRVLPPDGPWAEPAVLHDFLYRTKLVSRRCADMLLLEAMDCKHVGFWQKWTIFLAVRLFGGRSYHGIS